jgi:outer membrane protein assembly factor BamB
MRRLALLLLCVTVVLAFGQSRDEGKAPGCGLKTPAGKSERLYGPTTVEELHLVLRKAREPHDAYLSAAYLGNELTVPLLLRRMRLDYGSSEPVLPPGMVAGFSDTQEHLADALRSITNTDQGIYYPRWAAWYQANRHLSQHQWILSGFAAKRLHSVEPLDERFAFELIGVIGRGRDYHDYHAFNARRLLAKAPPALRAGWVVRASASEERFNRLGAIAILKQIDTAGNEDLLRHLAADEDVEVRRAALTVLNERLRVSHADGTGARILHGASDDNTLESITLAGDLLLALFRNGDMKAFETPTFREVWKKRVASARPVRLLITGNQLIIATEQGDLFSIDTQGRELWQKIAGNRTDDMEAGSPIIRLLRQGDELIVVRTKSLERLDLKTGATTSTISEAETVLDADSTQQSLFFLDNKGLHSLDGPRLDRPLPVPAGVSATPQSVCVTYGGPDGRVTCFAPDTMSPKWTRPVGGYVAWGNVGAPFQDTSQVVVRTDKELMAFRASDGSILWTTQGQWESHGQMTPTNYGLLLENRDYALELRDPATGEVRRVWPQVKPAQIAVQQQYVAVRGLNGDLWLIDLREFGTLQPPTSKNE